MGVFCAEYLFGLFYISFNDLGKTPYVTRGSIKLSGSELLLEASRSHCDLLHLQMAGVT